MVLKGKEVLSKKIANAGSTYIASILSAITSFSAALLSLLGVHDKWVMYRTAAEFIKSQYTLYCAHVEPYNYIDRDEQYLARIEAYMAGIHGQWQALQSNLTDSNESGNMGNEPEMSI